jgi:selenide,water dikinase
VHALTDVTGFGLLGHLLEMCRGATLEARIHMATIPLLDNVLALAEAGLVTGASARNWGSYGDDVRLAPPLEGAFKALLCDPQTSGGLLVACAPEARESVLETFARHGCEDAAIIGALQQGRPCVIVNP